MEKAVTSHPFSLDHYRTILNEGLAQRYAFRLIGEPVEGRTVYLRHDIDNSIDSALTVARIEAEMGVRATYLFLLRSANYNLMRGDAIGKVRTIAALGHLVGLHHSCEPGDIHPDDEPLAKRILADARTLEAQLRIPVRVFSLHNPGERDDFRIDVPGLINCYSAPYFADIPYLSESNFRWRNGCPCLLLREARYSALQLLVHPMTFCDRLESDRDGLLYFLHRKLVELRDVNVPQTGGLRDVGLSMTDIAAYIMEKSRDAE